MDLNPGMLAVAASITPPEMGIEWREANAEAIPLADETFDVVFCQFGLHDHSEIRRLLDAAGFREIAIRPIAKTVHALSAADFLWGYVHSTPLAGILAQASADRRAALERDVVTASGRFVTSHGLTFERGVVAATGRK